MEEVAPDFVGDVLKLDRSSFHNNSEFRFRKFGAHLLQDEQLWKQVEQYLPSVENRNDRSGKQAKRS